MTYAKNYVLYKVFNYVGEIAGNEVVDRFCTHLEAMEILDTKFIVYIADDDFRHEFISNYKLLVNEALQKVFEPGFTVEVWDSDKVTAYMQEMGRDLIVKKDSTAPDQVSLPLGRNDMNKTEPLAMPGNILITGGAGCGRAGFLSNLVLNGVAQYTPEEMNFWIYDSRMRTFDGLKAYDIPHITEFISEESQKAAEMLVMGLNEEVLRRRDMILLTDKLTFQEYFKETGIRLAPQLVVIVDFADNFQHHIMYESKAEIRQMLGNAVLLSRALDISLIFSFRDYRIIEWGEGFNPYLFPIRIAMFQNKSSAEQTLGTKLSLPEDKLWGKSGSFWINTPCVHRLDPLTLDDRYWEYVLDKKFKRI